MQVGQVSQTVEVTTEAPTVELTSSTLSAPGNRGDRARVAVEWPLVD